MSLDGALSIATRSLANINVQLGVVSNNVANVNTPDYAAERGTQTSLVAGNQGMGVHTGVVTRAIDLALRQATFRQDSAVAGLTVTTNSLQVIDAVQGTPGQGGDLAGLLGKVGDAFSGLLGDPGNGARQAGTLAAADALAGGINALSAAYTAQRQAAQTDLAAAVGDANAALASIGALSNQIIAARVGGQSTADLENQRDAAVHDLSGLLDVRMLNQPNGDLILVTPSGAALPTRGDPTPLRTTDVPIGPQATHPGAIPAITLNGIDVTSRLGGGRIGADLALRDTTLPGFQAGLDEFAFSLATRFDAQGLTLFTDPNGAVPAGGGAPAQSTYVGFSASIQVNSAVAADPATLRDGTHAVAGSPSGASAFAPNPPGGPAGFSTLVNRVLSFALGTRSQPGVGQPAVATTGLGPNGDLATPLGATASLADHAAALVAAQAAESGAAAARLTTEQAVRKNLNDRMTATSGVNMDGEMAHMIQLQNAYAASARIISSVQTLFDQLLQAVR